MTPIYLDNNATTQIDPLVVQAMRAELEAGPSNPSSIHALGRAAHARLSKARSQVATYFSVDPSELIFTSSGTEALNLAIRGLAPKGPIITSRIEHAAVLRTLEQTGCPLIYLPVGPSGHIDLNDLKEAITPQTSLIVLAGVNNETGVKNPIDEIASIALFHQIPLIVDAVAWLSKDYLTIPPGVTAMAFSGHKIHGPKGIGLLFVRKKTNLSPQLLGGGQERMRRAGTENLAGIIGFAKAIELIDPKDFEKIGALRDLLETSLDMAVVNGTGPRVCNTTNLMFPNTDGEGLLIHLDREGICASMGSACSAGSLEPSHVLLNMGLTRKEALSSIRFSLSRFTTEEEIRLVVAKTPSGQRFS